MGQKKKKNDEEFEGDGEEFVSLNISAHAKRSIAAIFLFVVAALFTLGFFNAAGVAGSKMTSVLGLIFGWGKYIAPLVFLYVGLILLKKKVQTRFYVTKIVGMALAFWGILALLHLLPFDPDQFREMAREGIGGGYVGYMLGGALAKFTGKIAGTIILLALVLVGLIVAFNMSLVGIGDRLSLRKKKKEKTTDETLAAIDEETDEEEDDNEEEQFDDVFDDMDEEDIVPMETPIAESQEKEKSQDTDNHVIDENVLHANTSDDIDWELPPLKLLNHGRNKAKGGDIKQNALRIKETFQQFGIAVELEDIVTGPTVTQYSFRPQSGVRLSRITDLNSNLALALAAHPIRIEAPIPGKSLVGIEVPNKATATVYMRDLLNADEFNNSDKKLLLALGEDVNGDYVIEDLAKMPHLLVAGATGTGKSVAINTILLSLLYKNAPDELKLILVDPKRVELSLYNGIPHLLSDAITDNGKVINALKWAVGEMERRYKLLQDVGARDIESYNIKRATGEKHIFTDPETGEQVTEEMEKMPVIVIVIDELSDLMLSHGKEVESVIVRLAQMSRAVGIHLVISTQRPSVEVITGLIKANIPSRIALKVAQNIDSRTIIDMPGAEKLVGNGDMLFVAPQSSTPKRLQGPFVNEEEVKKVVQFIKKQAKSLGLYDISEDFSGGDEEGGSENEQSNTANSGMIDFSSEAVVSSSESEDPIYEEAKQIVIEAGKASTSYIQRRLRIGYSRAARIMDELEDNGVVGPQRGSKPREILVASEGDANVSPEDSA